MPMPTERVPFVGVGFDLLTMDEVLERLSAVTAATPYGYVVTPNVDHVVRLDDAAQAAELAPLYERRRPQPLRQPDHRASRPRSRPVASGRAGKRPDRRACSTR